MVDSSSIEVPQRARRRKTDRIDLFKLMSLLVRYLGGDIDPHAVFCTGQNLGRRGGVELEKWDSTELPLARRIVDRLICNPPFGKQLSKPEDIPDLYDNLVAEWDRVLKPGGRAVLLVAEQDALRSAIAPHAWRPVKQMRCRVLGQPAVLGELLFGIVLGNAMAGAGERKGLPEPEDSGAEDGDGARGGGHWIACDYGPVPFARRRATLNPRVPPPRGGNRPRLGDGRRGE